MRKQILELEKISRELEPSSELRAAWTNRVNDYANNFIDNIEDLPAYVEPGDHGKAILDHDFSEGGMPLEMVLGILEKNVDGIGLNPASGGHLGCIPGGGIYTTALGDYLSAVTNRYAGIFYGGPGAVRIENQLIR